MLISNCNVLIPTCFTRHNFVVTTTLTASTQSSGFAFPTMTQAEPNPSSVAGKVTMYIFYIAVNKYHLPQQLTVMVTTTSAGDTEDPNTSSSPSSTVTDPRPMTDPVMDIPTSPSMSLIAGILGAALMMMLIIAIVIILAIITLRKRREGTRKHHQELPRR